MLRRDFIKFLGVLGVVASLPVVGPGVIETTPALDIPDGMKLTFNFGSNTVVVVADDGNLTYSEQRELDFISHRGRLEPYDNGGTGYLDFDLQMRARYISNAEFFNKTLFINKTKNEDFNLVVDDLQAQFVLNHCRWHTLEFDFPQGLFHIAGVAPSHAN
jgi:hypothetical protein